MIKSNVTLNGVITQGASVRSGNEGDKYLGFTVKTTIPGKTGNKDIEVSVSKDGTEADIPMFAVGSRIEIVGVLTFRKRGDSLYLNLRASSVNFSPTSVKNSIEGTMEFTGTIGKTVEEKTDKKGNSYLTFSAFSTEKVGEDFVYTWVRFLKFSAEKEAFLTGKAKIHAKGKMELSVYYDTIGISCVVSEICEKEMRSDVTQ